MEPIPHTQHYPICARANMVVVAYPTPFRRRFNLRKADWDVYSTELGKLIEDIEPIPENYGWFQRLPPARGGTAQMKIFHLANWSQIIHPGPSSSRSRFFMESSQLYAATLTHYSTEPQTTGLDYDPLLLLLALAGGVYPNLGPSRYPCSVCFKNALAKVPSTCVQDVCIGYIQDVLVFETLQIIVKPMAGSVPPV